MRGLRPLFCNEYLSILFPNYTQERETLDLISSILGPEDILLLVRGYFHALFFLFMNP